MNSSNKVFCVISHTHWDREWYMPLENFRHRLVDLMDRLLAVLEKNPAYIFHLDAQTVVIEDYLAVRPEKKEILRQYISKHRLIVGPWYLQNDFYLTSGESTVRNLLEGQKICREFGASSKVGYAADQFGNISQLPQILKGFGIDNFVFGRGFTRVKTDENGIRTPTDSPTEFIWQGADGTKALAIYMRHFYNNAQRFSADIEKATRHLQIIAKNYENEFTFTPYILLMNGVDHLEAQPDILQIVEGVQKNLPEGQYFLQYNFDDYITAVKDYINDNEIELDTEQGELRFDKWISILQGTLSSRAYLKAANNEAQIMLENRLEPLYSMIEMNGMNGVYPHDRLVYTWKNLLRNHPHDSICGCSHDAVHRHMENRYEEIKEFSDELLNRAMKIAAEHTAVFRNSNKNDYLITVANTLAIPQSGMAEVKVRIKCEDEIENFRILDENGNPVKFIIKSKKQSAHNVYSPINLPGWFYVWDYCIYLEVGTVEAYSFKNFIITKSDEVMPCLKPIEKQKFFVISNKNLKVSVSKDGKVDITDLSSGRTLEDFIRLEDMADSGDSYSFVPAGDIPVYSDNCHKTVELLEDNEFVSKIMIEYRMELPAAFVHAENHRSEEKKLNTVRLYLTLKKDSRFLEVDYQIENTSKDHCLRLCIDSDISPVESYADSPFDIICRTDSQHFPDAVDKSTANTSFVALQEKSKGVAVFTVGAHHYEHPADKLSRIAITLLRATGKIAHYGTENWETPDNQCLRTISGRMAVCPFEGDIYKSDIPNLSLSFRAPLIAACTSCDPRKFAGGRPCVQDTDIAEYFYLPDEYPQIAIKDNCSALSVKGDNISVSAFKISEDESGLILRLYNYSDKKSAVTVKTKARIFETELNEITRRFLGDDSVNFTVSPKEIVTLYIQKYVL